MKHCLFFLVLLAFSIPVKAQPSTHPADSTRRQYLAAQKQLGRSFSNYFYPNYAAVYTLPAAQFVGMIDSTRRLFTGLLARYKPTLDPRFVQEQEIEIKYYFEKLLIEYPYLHEIYGGKRINNDLMVRERMPAHIRDFNKPALLSNEDFRNYVKAYLSLEVNRLLKDPVWKTRDNQRLEAVWQLVSLYMKNDSCRNYWQYQYLFDHIDNKGIKNIEKIYRSFLSTCGDTGYLSKIRSLYTAASVERKDHLIKTYKKAGAFDLDLHIFLPDSVRYPHARPAMVYFHGGSWTEGSPSWHFADCKRYARAGWVACAVEYRIYGRHNTLPFEAVKDARSAIRWLRMHAAQYGIDTNRIVASGNSAGGHLVLATALADKWNEQTDNRKYSPAPNVLLVTAGAYDLTDNITAWIRKDLDNKDIAREISPNDLVKKGMPPLLMIHGGRDQNVPYVTAIKFAELMKAAGNDFHFETIEGAGHFIFFDPKYSGQVAKWKADYLRGMGYPVPDAGGE